MKSAMYKVGSDNFMEKIIELSKEVGELKKENEILKVTINILEDKLRCDLNKDTFNENELDVLVNALDLLLNLNRTKYDGKKKIEKNQFNRELKIKKVLKKDIF
ncbi:hypothetical protein FDB15_03965 [Clostridium botulinum]|uniref:hypothetical protein n=1 Tax=unclassified Clostridium TaxID=2614128 RepID=UPI0013C6F26F|nr:MULTISPECIES: hypothetical protein [unclassified Clostridium]NFH99496.1 hypothetical protein [Clostridium botulinum]NFI62169.1 hypothetical protein [Clostridium botulinum]NFJ42625.1 hypothetical protein [Clostridium botulinum]NFJ46504.1 hypothetical protein [Clostridium botulinum]NFK26454.1 hypothetical protein [Clostridium botulinum]